jgi:hypothetical protein
MLLSHALQRIIPQPIVMGRTMPRLLVVGLITTLTATGSFAAPPKINDHRAGVSTHAATHKGDHQRTTSLSHVATQRSQRQHLVPPSKGARHRAPHQQPTSSAQQARHEMPARQTTVPQGPTTGPLAKQSAAPPPAAPGFCSEGGTWARRDGTPIEIKAKIHSSCRTGDRIVLPSDLTGLVKLACDQSKPLTPLGTPLGTKTSCILAP